LRLLYFFPSFFLSFRLSIRFSFLLFFQQLNVAAAATTKTAEESRGGSAFINAAAHSVSVK
jgi:hypothetical protein